MESTTGDLDTRLMKFPVTIGFESYQLSAHFVFESLAFIIGFRYFLFLRKTQSDSISDSNRLWISIGAIFGAFFFSRLLGTLENPMGFYYSQHKLLYFYINKTIVGGLLGALLVVELVKKSLGESRSSGDLLTFPLINVMIIGRIGCFCNGVYEQTYGEETKFIFGIDLGDGLSRHPVTLYEIAFLILLFLLLKLIEKKGTLRDGLRFQLFMIFYLFFRFVLDFIKPGQTFFWGLGTIQLSCVVGLLYYKKTIAALIFKPSTIYANHTS